MRTSNHADSQHSMTPLTDQEQTIVAENMGLVGSVIKKHVRDINNLGIFTYEDLFQIGCIGLCKAVKTDRSKCAKFSTYAYILIRNEIFMALEYASRRRYREPVTDPDMLREVSDRFEDNISSELYDAVKSAYAKTHGIIHKGILALCLYANGMQRNLQQAGSSFALPCNCMDVQGP